MTRSHFRFGSAVAMAAILAMAPQALAIRDATPLGLENLPGMVQVETVVAGSTKFCSGMVISSNTVLTAAHCVCTDNLIGGNVCGSDAVVRFRHDPNAPGSGQFSVALDGKVTFHSGYNPSWTESQYEHDLAIIKLENGVSPAHAKPLLVSDGYLADDATAMIAGRGFTGSSCNGSAGSFNYDLVPIAHYEDGHDILAFDDTPACPGDSGGAVLDEAGNWLFGVLSANTSPAPPLTPLTKAITTGSEFDWIKSHMCLSSSWNSCDGNGYVCNCTASTNLLWRATNGQLAIWFMDGATITAQTYPGLVQVDWQIKGSGDFNADGHQDILWRNANGQVAIWFMIDGANAGQAFPGGQDPGHAWTIQGVGDFDHDGYSDILWRDTAGQLAIWFQGDATQAAYPGYDNQPAPVDLAWKVLGIGDVDGDTYSDILWRHNDGQVTVWFMAGDLRVGDSEQKNLNNKFQLQAIGDFDGNLRSDILWRDATNGLLTIWFDGNAFNGGAYPTYGNLPPNYSGFLNPTWNVEGVGDFDHDGRDDILWRESGGQLAIWLVDGVRFVGDLYPQWVDTGWKIEGLLRPGISSAVRTVPEPQGLASLVLGIGLLAALQRRHARPDPVDHVAANA